MVVGIAESALERSCDWSAEGREDYHVCRFLGEDFFEAACCGHVGCCSGVAVVTLKRSSDPRKVMAKWKLFLLEVQSGLVCL